MLNCFVIVVVFIADCGLVYGTSNKSEVGAWFVLLCNYAPSFTDTNCRMRMLYLIADLVCSNSIYVENNESLKILWN